jgi:hypothetical protein
MSKNKDIIEAEVEMELIHPYHKSQETIIEMVNKWGMRLIKMGTHNEIAIIGIPADKFKKIFGSMPVVGKYSPPQGTTHFISSINVKKINILSDK